MLPTSWRNRKTPPILNAFQPPARRRVEGARAGKLRTGNRAPHRDPRKKRQRQGVTVPRQAALLARPPRESLKMERAAGVAAVAAAKVFGHPKEGSSPVRNRQPQQAGQRVRGS